MGHKTDLREISKKSPRRPALPRIGQVVEVTVLDHCEGGGVPIEFVVYGRLLSIDRTAMTVASWTYSDAQTHQDPKDPNIKNFTILRSTVKSVVSLGPI